MPYKDPAKKKAYNAKYREENKEALAKQQAQYYQENKENITYIATVCSDFYFGHSSIGLDKRKRAHFAHLRLGTANPGLQKHFDELGEQAFIKAFDMQILGTFKTVKEAKAEEAYLLSKYVGTSGCLNIQLH